MSNMPDETTGTGPDAGTMDEKAFTPRICRTERTAVICLGKGSQNLEEIMAGLDGLETDLGIDVAVLDMTNPESKEISDKYKLDPDTSQIVVFQKCDKVNGISLEHDLKAQVAKLKVSLDADKAKEEVSGPIAPSCEWHPSTPNP